MNKYILVFTVSINLFFIGCSTKSTHSYSNVKHKVYSSNKNDYSKTINKKDYIHPTMKSYVVHGVRYYPREVNVGDKFSGVASWYGPDFHGKLTSNGERYNMYEMTAAHKTLPMNTILKVTNRRNGRSAVVRVNDRGPFVATRIIDLSNSAAKKIDMIKTGTAPVTIEVLGFYSKNKNRYKKHNVTKSKSISNRKYSLQIASFQNIDGAIKIQEKFDNTDGYKTIIKDIKTSYGRLFKVYLTGFKTEKEIREYKQSSDFVNSFIVVED
jgi:rare lipoprotein A